MFLPTLYCRTNTGKIQEWTIEIEENKYRTVHGYEDGKRTESKWTTCGGKNLGRSNETNPIQQALAEAQAKHQKKQDSGYKLDKNRVDEVGFIEPMLARIYDDEKDKLIYPVFSQPKLDGIRCVCKADGMYTRLGNQIISCPHIMEGLVPFFARYPQAILDGELYTDKLKNDFNEICGMVKRTKPTIYDIRRSKETIEYWVYDYISEGKRNFEERFRTLVDIHLKDAPPCIVLVPTVKVENEKQLDDLFDHYLEQGMEGQIVRLNMPYEHKRSKHLLKRKMFLDGEWRILGIEEGNGNRAGSAGRMIFKTKDGVEFAANIKGNMTYLSRLLANKNTITGKMATIRYPNLTPDGVPRFPFVVGIRDYE